MIAQVNDPLYRAYLLNEQLRMIFRVPYGQAKVLLEQRAATSAAWSNPGS